MRNRWSYRPRPPCTRSMPRCFRYGLGILLVSIVVWCSNKYSRASAALGIIGALRFPLTLWPWGPAVDTIWLTWLGVAMLRKSFY